VFADPYAEVERFHCSLLADREARIVELVGRREAENRRGAAAIQRVRRQALRGSRCRCLLTFVLHVLSLFPAYRDPRWRAARCRHLTMERPRPGTAPAGDGTPEPTRGRDQGRARPNPKLWQ